MNEHIEYFKDISRKLSEANKILAEVGSLLVSHPSTIYGSVGAINSINKSIRDLKSKTDYQAYKWEKYDHKS